MSGLNKYVKQEMSANEFFVILFDSLAKEVKKW